MEGTVQKRFTSKKGTPCLEIGGQVYIAPKVDISNVQVGDKLEFQGHSFGDGKMWELDGFRLTSAAIKYPSSQQPQQGIAAPSALAVPAVGNMTEAERIFASVVVKGAFEAGLIKDKADLGIWTAHARDVLRNT